ncbi:MAG: two-component system response regulator CreB [Desulfobacterales bacterium]|nr:two-component system response regulator CreB [Desulfobacterales bacterium]
MGEMKHILIVEDESSIAENIQYALETEGFETTWLSEGRGVESLVRSGGADLIVLDIGLPDVNGMELCKKIRAWSSVPVIFLTARSDEIDRVVGLEIGGDDYMVKPFSPRELSARVKAVLRRTGGRDKNPAELSAGLSLDEERCLVSYCGRALDLPRYEFGILSLFITHPGRVYSRDQLMEMVWDDPGMSTDRTVDAHIKNIRAKLKKITPDIDPIKTHRGIGYSLREDI